MKRFQILFIMLLLAVTSFAQQGGGRRQQLSVQERAQKHAETLKAKLQLSDAQYQALYTQFLKSEEQMDKQRDAMRKMREENDQVIKNTLSPEQYVKFQEMQEQRRKMRQERKQGGMNDDPIPQDER